MSALLGLAAAILLAGWWFVWSDQLDALAARQQDELKLKEQFIAKKTLAVNLDLYTQQLSEIDRSFGALLGLVVAGTAGLAAYLATVWVVDRERLRDAVRLVRRTP